MKNGLYIGYRVGKEFLEFFDEIIRDEMDFDDFRTLVFADKKYAAKYRSIEKKVALIHKRGSNWVLFGFEKLVPILNPQQYTRVMKYQEEICRAEEEKESSARLREIKKRNVCLTQGQ